MAQVGVNVDGLASFSREWLTSVNSRAVRFVYLPRGDVVAVIRPWLERLNESGIKSLVVLAHESTEALSWREAVQHCRDDLGDLVTWYQLLNEPDAGWLPDPDDLTRPNPNGPSIEQRRADNPSSWVLEPEEIQWRLEEARQELGDDAILVGPGLSSGHPSFCSQLDWGAVNYGACHPYAKDPDTPAPREPIDDLLNGYLEWFDGLFVSEYDSRTPGMHRAMARDARVLWAFAFCAGDSMVPPFGMIDVDGNPKPSLAEFTSANSPGPEPRPGPDPQPGAKFQLGFKAWHDLEPQLIGDALKDESNVFPGAVQAQPTTRGTLVWVSGHGHAFITRDGRKYRWVEGTPSSEEVP